MRIAERETHLRGSVFWAETRVVDDPDSGAAEVTYTPHPLRIQRRRTKGYKMPPGAVYVGRPTIWGNPFETASEYRELAEAIAGVSGQSEFHKTDLRSFGVVYNAVQLIEELRGKQLACWCPLDKPCHADILCELANR